MATAQRENNGTFTAVWRDASGKRVSAATGETVFERAIKRAQAIEAEARFWEDQVEGVWQRLADAGFSPRYTHSIFIARAHLEFPAFKELLKEAKIRFKPCGAWRDRTRPKGRTTDKRWQFQGESLTMDELMEHAAYGLTRGALRFRLGSGWDVAEAVTTGPISRAEAGRMGAEISNNPQRKEAA